MTTDKGLMVWLPLLGNTCNQGINSKYNTVNAGIPQWTTEGKLGNQCLNVQTYADALHYTDTLDETKDMTICAWIKSTSTTNTDRYIIWIGSDVNNTGYGMRMSEGTSIEFRMWKGSKTIALTLNTWTHVAMVIDMTALKFTAYVNGVKQGDPISFTKATTATGGGFNIGFLRPNFYPFLGQIQDVRVYSYQLGDSQCKELSRGKVGHWLGDGNGTSKTFLSDISGFGKHGNITGGITLSSDTKRYDKSLNFSTSDGRAYASIVQPISNSPSAMTIAFWIKPDSASASSYRQCFSFNNGNAWLSINTESNKVQFYQGDTLYVRSSNGILDSNWHHIAMVWNGSQYQFYIDGIADTTTCTSATNNTLNIVAPQISTFIIGNNYTGTYYNGRLFKDYLSDIRLYATALSADDVKELYSLGH